MHLNLCWPNFCTSARTLNLTQHVLTIEVAKRITTWVHKTPPMLAMKQNVSQLALTKLNDVNEDTEYFSACDEQTQPMPAMTQNVPQNVLTKLLPFQGRHEMHHNIWWTNLSQSWDDTKCISTCVDQMRPMPARKQNVSQKVLTKPVPCLQGREIYLNMCWQNPSHSSEETKCISRCDVQTPPSLGMTQNPSQHVLTKQNPCQRGRIMHLNMCWPNPSHAARTQN